MGSITEVVQTVKNPKSTIRAKNDDTSTKHEEKEKMNYDFALPKLVETGITSTPSRQTSSLNFQGDHVSRVSSYEGRSKISRKSEKGYWFIHISALVFNNMLN